MATYAQIMNLNLIKDICLLMECLHHHKKMQVVRLSLLIMLEDLPAAYVIIQLTPCPMNLDKEIVVMVRTKNAS